MSAPDATAARNASEPECANGAVADVLHVVALLQERCHPDPLSTLATHLRDAGDIAHLVLAHQQNHGVTADPGADKVSGPTFVELLCGQPEQK